MTSQKVKNGALPQRQTFGCLNITIIMITVIGAHSKKHTKEDQQPNSEHNNNNNINNSIDDSAQKRRRRRVRANSTRKSEKGITHSHTRIRFMCRYVNQTNEDRLPACWLDGWLVGWTSCFPSSLDVFCIVVACCFFHSLVRLVGLSVFCLSIDLSIRKTK